MPHTQVQDFINYTKKYTPRLKLAFKSNSKFMKFLGTLLFFNPDFMNTTTTLGNTIYLPDENKYNANPDNYLTDVVSGFIHIMDYKKFNILLPITFLLPQLLAPLVVPFSFLGFHHSHYWLFALFGILLLLPLPSYFRFKWKLREHLAGDALEYWENKYRNLPLSMAYLNNYLNATFWFMWPFRENMVNRIQKGLTAIKNNSILKDRAFRIIHDWVIYFGRIDVQPIKK
jgi:hypothetical protein